MTNTEPLAVTLIRQQQRVDQQVGCAQSCSHRLQKNSEEIEQEYRVPENLVILMFSPGYGEG
jgi:hypothetical protein